MYLKAPQMLLKQLFVQSSQQELIEHGLIMAQMMVSGMQAEIAPKDEERRHQEHLRLMMLYKFCKYQYERRYCKQWVFRTE